MKDFFKILIAITPLLILASVPELTDNIIVTALLLITTAVLLPTWALKDLFIAAKSFVTDPDAGKVSKYKFNNGNPMSVREAKQKGFIDPN